jgi:3-oxoacyl-[acyl-carrier-protein] synthase-3
MRTVLLGTGMYVPENVIKNEKLSQVMDTSDEWIQQRTGIEARCFASPGQGSSDMAVPAAEAAVRDAGIEKSEIDYVVFATMTPDHYFPGAGAEFQHKFGLDRVPVLDIRQQCAGFLYALQLADAMIKAGQYRTILVIGAEVHAGFMPWNWDAVLGDAKISEEEFARNTTVRDRTVIFGDGAGAFVLQASAEAENGLLDVKVHSDGEYWDRLHTPSVGSAYRPYVSDDTKAIDRVPIVKGREVFKLASILMPEVVLQVLERNDLTIDDLDLLVMHQANLRINNMVQKRLGLPDEKVFNNIQRYGNTTAATLPMAFHEARKERGVKSGDLVCFVALGSGLNWGAALYRY